MGGVAGARATSFIIQSQLEEAVAAYRTIPAPPSLRAVPGRPFDRRPKVILTQWDISCSICTPRQRLLPAVSRPCDVVEADRRDGDERHIRSSMLLRCNSVTSEV